MVEGDRYLRWLWDEQSRWSQRADELKAGVNRNRRDVLVLVVAAAVLVTASGPLAEVSPWISRIAVGAALVCGSAAARKRMSLGRDRLAAWTRTRSVSESLKSLTYTYLAGVGPYRGDGADETLKSAVSELLRSGSDLAAGASTQAAVPRDLPAVWDVASYVTQRVDRQRDGYYEKQSRVMGDRADRFSRMESLFFYIGAVLSAVILIFPGPWLAPWVAVLTTVSGAVAAHAAVQRYGALQLEYAQAAHELERLVSSRRALGGLTAEQLAAEDDGFVAAAESVISNQNEAWMVSSLDAAQTSEKKTREAVTTVTQQAQSAARKA
ncbi:DUF4231 domain-containing protein [Kineosporia sp. J2-2]|uniref:DUF4231 domain-containing protein n=1 Tax=Kineosporia corallincola TaxID=2835133 RepID=A0ABS5TB34_9ACTN|nr:DUF4231 domain-containing protein [Kineosporia corallincola]MBT0768292.1 DUF4231 domain-containing protein [Kineosporia corallincola]